MELSTALTVIAVLLLLSIADAARHWDIRWPHARPAARLSANLCNDFNPNCGLTPAQAQERLLTPYLALVDELLTIKRRSRIPIEVAPLIFNQTSQHGLLNIDVPLNLSLAPAVNVSICGPDTIPTIRHAVVCTVTKDPIAQPPRGNTDASRIGLSNQGRLIWGARLGNRNGTRVLLVTQQHGNEAASTEAALKFLRKLTLQPHLFAPLMSAVDLLIVVRANPDGGEVSAQGFPLPVGAPYTRDAGFFRHNVDPSAGGGFANDTEPDFFGVVGRGYDMNRYNYGGLQAAIRPVENQALVAAIHAFRPDVLFDAHGDLPKVLCELDPLTFRPPSTPAGVPSVQCRPPVPPIPTLATARDAVVLGAFFAEDASVLTGPQFAALQSGPRFTANVRFVRSVAAAVVHKLDPRIPGRFSRFNQIVLGIAKVSEGTLDRAPMPLGAVGSGWEVYNFVPQLRPAVTSFRLLNGSVPDPTIGFDLPAAEPCFLRDNICIQERMMQETLLATAQLSGERLTGDNGYCAIPLNDGLLVDFPAAAGFRPAVATNGTTMVPQGGQLGVPVIYVGACAGDAQ